MFDVLSVEEQTAMNQLGMELKEAFNIINQFAEETYGPGYCIGLKAGLDNFYLVIHCDGDLAYSESKDKYIEFPLDASISLTAESLPMKQIIDCLFSDYLRYTEDYAKAESYAKQKFGKLL